MPSQVSALAIYPELLFPPASIAEVCVPPPAHAYLIVFTSPTSVQLVPSQDSLLLTPVVVV